ncbi:LysR family transcriptional regulator [soil metagenome]
MLVSAVDEGTLADAARKLGRSPAAVTRSIATLESQIGERLLHRSSRQLRLTEAGERRLPIYRHVLAELARAESQSGPGAVSGSLVVTAPELFGRMNVMPTIETFLDRHHGVTARVLLLNRITDLVKEGIDVAVRLAPLPDSGLSAVNLGEVHRVLCATPAYLATHGAPAQPKDLSRHICIGRNEASDNELWPFVVSDNGRRRARSFQVATRLSSNSAGAALDAVLRGQGLGWFLSYQVAAHFASRALIRVMPAFEPAATPVQLVFHPKPKRGGAIREYIDHATPLLRAVLVTVREQLGQSLERPFEFGS